MALSRRALRHERTRQEIKQIARQQMAQQGAASLSLRRIAAEMGMSAPSLYNYYSNRDDLVTDLLVDSYTHQAEVLEQASASCQTQETIACLLATLLAYRQWAVEHPTEFALIIENGKLSEAVRAFSPDGIDGVLDLIGNSTLLDSLRMARKGGHVCVAGFLGRSEPVSFDWLENMLFGVDLNAFASLLFGTKNFPHSEIPMQKLVDRVAESYASRETEPPLIPAHLDWEVLRCYTLDERVGRQIFRLQTITGHQSLMKREMC
jgi:AcrR family transcriptional regulator